MPGKGYATVGMKPTLISRLQDVTDKNYPGMFLPSTLIIMMNEVKRGYYTVDSHNFNLDLLGQYNSITIRADVKDWLEENYKNLAKKYYEKYKIKSFAKFLSYFLINMFESKAEAQNHVVKLNASDFKWLISEYKKRNQKKDSKDDSQTFERFADEFLKELLEKVNEARRVLTT